MMRTLRFALSVGVLLLSASAASAAGSHAATSDAGQISASTLAQIGLGGMDRLSDEEGLAVRAKGLKIYQYVYISVEAKNENVYVPPGTVRIFQDVKLRYK